MLRLMCCTPCLSHRGVPRTLDLAPAGLRSRVLAQCGERGPCTRRETWRGSPFLRLSASTSNVLQPFEVMMCVTSTPHYPLLRLPALCFRIPKPPSIFLIWLSLSHAWYKDRTFSTNFKANCAIQPGAKQPVFEKARYSPSLDEYNLDHGSHARPRRCTNSRMVAP
jgi:hypothetical protein